MKNDTSPGTSLYKYKFEQVQVCTSTSLKKYKFELLTNTFMYWNLTLVDTNLLHESINMRVQRSEREREFRDQRERERVQRSERERERERTHLLLTLVKCE